MKKTIALAAAAATALALTGCGRDDGGGAGGKAQSDEISEGAATGTIEVWAMGTEGEELGDFVADFEAANPDADVKVTPIPWESAHDKLANAIAAGETPDVSLIGTTWMGEFAEAGGLMPTPEGLVDEADFFPGAWESTEVGGTSYGVPWYVETRVLYYRTDLAKKAGWDEAPKTWDELKQFASRPADQGRGGVRDQPAARPDRLVADDAAVRLDQRREPDQRRRHGVHDRLRRDRQRHWSTTPPSSRRACPRAGCSTPVSPRAASPTASSGRSSPAPGTPPWWRTPGTDPADYAVAPLPGKDGEPGTSFVGGGDLAVFEDSDNPDGAWKLVQWLSEADTQQAFYERSATCPPSRTSWETGELAEDPRLKIFGQQLESAQSPPSVPTWEQVAAAIDSVVEQAALRQGPAGPGGRRDAVPGGVDRDRPVR